MTNNKIQIFLSTYNGRKYLVEQVESLRKLKNVSVSLLVRDDGSTDGTIDILEYYAKVGVLQFYSGQNIGYAKSFFDLIKQDVKADYYAFCDQDDIWNPEKLCVAVTQIQHIADNSNKIPILYASALQRVDSDLNYLKKQNFEHLQLTLGAEFTRHRLAGCSFVFNNMLRNLLKYEDNIPCSHDKLATILCLACGGKVIFDHDSYILFRRHGNNTSSDDICIKHKISQDLHKYFGRHNNADLLAAKIIQQYSMYLTPEALNFLYKIAHYKNSAFYTLRLAMSPNINCGFWYFNFFIRMMMILRLF